MDISGSGARDALLAAKRQVALEKEREVVEAEQLRQKQQLRQRRFAEGSNELREIRNVLLALLADVPRWLADSGEYSEGRARIVIEKPVMFPPRTIAFMDVWATSSIELKSTSRNGQPNSWSATLFYMSSSDEAAKWMEVAFYDSMTTSRGPAPRAVNPTDQNFALAIGQGMHSLAAAYGPLPITGEREGHFNERWISLFAKAMVGDLVRPSSFPLKSPEFI